MLLSLLLTLFFAHGEYVKPEKLKNPPDHYQQARDATGKLKVVDRDSRCTAFFVSDSGYALTNLHCLQSCLQHNKLMVNGASQSQWGPLIPSEKSKHHNLWRSGKTLPKGINCKYANLDFFKPDQLYGGAELIAIGRGFGTVSNNNIDQLSQADYQLLADNIDDYAILKFNVYNKPVSCIPIAEDQAFAGEKLFSLGYPTATSRKGEQNSDGIKKFATYGSYVMDIRDDKKLKSLGLSALAWARQTDLTGRSRFIKTSLDVVNGASGSPALNANGEAIGILYSSTGASPTSPNLGTTFAIKTEYIYQETLRKLGKKMANDIFNCSHPKEQP